MSQQLLHTMQGLEMVLIRSRNSKRLFMDNTEEGAAGYWQHRVVASHHSWPGYYVRLTTDGNALCYPANSVFEDSTF
jgi:hypothetical protein